MDLYHFEACFDSSLNSLDECRFELLNLSHRHLFRDSIGIVESDRRQHVDLIRPTANFFSYHCILVHKNATVLDFLPELNANLLALTVGEIDNSFQRLDVTIFNPFPQLINTG